MVLIIGIGAGLVVWKKGHAGSSTSDALNVITRQEIESLLADVAKTNPAAMKRFAEDPEMKKNQLDSFRQLLAFASEAQRTGLADQPTNKQELDNIKAEIEAVNYDKEINKDKGSMPPFGFITDDQIKAYWAEDGDPKAPKDGGRSHADEFQAFLDTKIEILKKGNPEMANREISDDEKNQAKDVFAKIRLYRREYEQKAASGELTEEFVNKVKLQNKLQQAQFLARVYSEQIADQMKVTDDEINNYIAEHTELDPKEKRAKAQEILDRINKGEDFAKLADELSEDPGTKGKGGLYENVPKGQMVAPFEAAALALEPGQVSSAPVETDFGFHIIKLERKLGPSPKKDDKSGAPAGDTYDVRHILISTNYTDPDKPNSRPMPIKEYVRGKLEEAKEKDLIDKLVAQNNVSVPDDFTIPTPSDEDIQKMQQQQLKQMQMQPGGPGAPDAPDAKAKPGDKKSAPAPAAKPEPKKK